MKRKRPGNGPSGCWCFIQALALNLLLLALLLWAADRKAHRRSQIDNSIQVAQVGRPGSGRRA